MERNYQNIPYVLTADLRYQVHKLGSGSFGINKSGTAVGLRHAVSFNEETACLFYVMKKEEGV